MAFNPYDDLPEEELEEPAPRRGPRSTVKVLGTLLLVTVAAAFALVACLRAYVGSVPPQTLEVPLAELANNVPKFIPLPSLGSTNNQTHGIWITLRGDGSVLALLSRDPGSGCVVAWQARVTTFTNVYRDPCRGATYSPEGNAIFGPARRDLDRYPARVVDDHVLVDREHLVVATPVPATTGTPTPTPMPQSPVR